MNKKRSLTLAVLMMMHAMQVKASEFDHQKWLAFCIQQLNEHKNLYCGVGVVAIIILRSYLQAITNPKVKAITDTKDQLPESNIKDFETVIKQMINQETVYKTIKNHLNYILFQKKQYISLKSQLDKTINLLMNPPNTSQDDQNNPQAKWSEFEKLLAELNELPIVCNTKVGRLKDVALSIQKATDKISGELTKQKNSAARSLLLPEYEKKKDTLHNAINLTMRTFKRNDTIDTILHSYLEKAESTFKNGTIMTYEAWVDAGINNRFSWQKYLNYFKKKQCENHKNLHIGAMIIPEDCTLHIIGDVHAAAESIQSIMQNFIKEGIMDENWKLKDPAKHKVILMGDLVDKGWHTIETLIFLSHFKAVNKEESVLVLRGNHDDLSFHYSNGWNSNGWTSESFVNELQARMPALFEDKTPTDQGLRLLNKIDNFFSKMVCLYLLKKNKNNYDVLQFFHAAPDPVYHPKALFEHAIKRGENRLAFEIYSNNIFNDQSSEIKQHKEYKSTYFNEESIEKMKNAQATEPWFSFVSFLWGSLEKNDENLFFQYTAKGGPQIKCNEQMIKDLRKEQRCTINGAEFSIKAMIRGHQHCYSHKIDKDRHDYNDTMTIMENIIKDGYSHWLSENNSNCFSDDEANIFTVPPLISNLYGAPSNVHRQDGVVQPGLHELRITKITTFDKLESVMVQ
ncbi:metallophosphoesterase [bacterium]|nr:MAG: metallophosphoesterase [bacterium]